MLLVVDTHPIQYHAPVYRAVQQRCGIPVTAVYGTDCSVRGYTDREFGTSIAWDTDLLSGYTSRFLSTTASGGAATPEATSVDGLDAMARSLSPEAALLGGYGTRFHRAARRILRRAGIPILFRGETTDVAVDRPWWKSPLRDAVLRRAYADCAALLYIGKESLAHYQRLGVLGERLIFSPYCVDATTFAASEDDRSRLRAPTRESLGCDDDDVVLLFSGKLSNRKGPDLIVEALRRWPRGGEGRMVAVFVGDGELRPALEATARAAGIEARFVGFQPQRALSAFYHAADLLVLPSRFGETWGLVVNEALLHGLPCVVSSRVGCAVDLIAPSGAGEVVTPDSSAALMQGCLQLLPRRSLELRQACRRAVTAYSVERAAEGIAAAVHRIRATVATASP